jgi:hypothetical protein
MDTQWAAGKGLGETKKWEKKVFNQQTSLWKSREALCITVPLPNVPTTPLWAHHRPPGTKCGTYPRPSVALTPGLHTQPCSPRMKECGSWLWVVSSQES